MIKEFFGDNFQDALINARKNLGLEESEFSYKKLDGIFGSNLRGKKVGILVDYEKVNKGMTQGEELSSWMLEYEKIKDDKDSIAPFLLEKILLGVGKEVEISTEEKEDLVVLSVRFIGEKPDTKRGEIREFRSAIQYIINRAAGEGRENRKRYIVDFNGDMDKRKELMKEIGTELSFFVKKIKQTLQVGLMDSQDRRLLHLALVDDTEIKTFSQGEGRFRALCIKPGDAE